MLAMSPSQEEEGTRAQDWEAAWLDGPAPSHPLSPAGPLPLLITAAFQHFFALYGKALGTRPAPANSQGGGKKEGGETPPKEMGCGLPPHIRLTPPTKTQK